VHVTARVREDVSAVLLPNGAGSIVQPHVQQPC